MSVTPIRRRMTKAAFTLVELLVVICIIVVLAVLAIPSMRSLLHNQSINSTVQQVTGILDNARQAAISKNSYVWVALSNPAEAPGSLWVAVFMAKDGNNILDLAADTTSADLNHNDAFQLLQTPQSYAHVTLMDNATDLSQKPASLEDDPTDRVNINLLQPAAIKFTAGNKVMTLTRLMAFTPNGQALSDVELNQYIEFVLYNPNRPKDPAVFHINGNTGNITVFRN